MANIRPTYQQELRKRQADALSRRNQQERDDVARRTGSVGGNVVSTEDAVVETQKRDNNITLLAGTHGGMLITKPQTTIQGVPGTVIERLVEVDTTNDITTFKHIHFRCLSSEQDNVDSLVTVKAGSTAVFIGCVFEKPDPVPCTNHVTVEANAFAHFHGCSFIPDNSTAGFTVNNAGAAANVSVHGCSRKTTQPHNNVTVYSEST